jgi:hypothetical protein
MVCEASNELGFLKLFDLLWFLLMGVDSWNL